MGGMLDDSVGLTTLQHLLSDFDGYGRRITLSAVDIETGDYVEFDQKIWIFMTRPTELSLLHRSHSFSHHTTGMVEVPLWMEAQFTILTRRLQSANAWTLLTTSLKLLLMSTSVAPLKSLNNIRTHILG